MRAAYRIVYNYDIGYGEGEPEYIVQVRRWWWPFWCNHSLGFFVTLADAEQAARRFASPVAKDLGKLP